MKKTLVWLLFMFGAGVVFGWWSSSAAMFPDPYHQSDEPVTFFVWCYRELDELLNGEK